MDAKGDDGRAQAVHAAQRRAHARLEPLAHDVREPEDVLAQEDVAREQEEDGRHAEAEEAQHARDVRIHWGPAHSCVEGDMRGASASDMATTRRG